MQGFSCDRHQLLSGRHWIINLNPCVFFLLKAFNHSHIAKSHGLVRLAIEPFNSGSIINPTKPTAFSRIMSYLTRRVVFVTPYEFSCGINFHAELADISFIVFPIVFQPCYLEIRNFIKDNLLYVGICALVFAGFQVSFSIMFRTLPFLFVYVKSVAWFPFH